MIVTVKRNLALYFSSKSSVFFSLMGAWIAFALYLIFLQKNMLDNWKTLPDAELVLDKWVMAGTLAVTSITTTWTGIVRMIRDKESQRFADFLLTDTSAFKLNLGYFISAALIGMLMQIMMFTIMVLYFYWQDGLTIELLQAAKLLGVMLISSILAASLSLLLGQLFQSTEAAERFSVIIGTASGFLVGVYVPIGTLPDFAQQLIKVTPAAYAAAASRQILLTDYHWGQSAGTIKAYLGVGLKWDRLTSLNQNIAAMVGVILLSFMVLGLFQFVKKTLLR
ncbi:ABC transporter permease [Streptococcus chenjunshii]|uniref:ABC transporter permease n=1 Tax=Streptococcus chenjunshii TaxID=2173853 RepID=A0A372KKY9_9STRE|nr:ABC transporter permease [Streptococcus chenjunshii]AXQ79391.1 ABC transporter permease [Streptococcus chenjunshii]RFU50086.1 ABC transporter permease [Streptococcus chenjunshii]RFU52248.1 ABC transporter permease [Streptococcus chenjunshii]